MEQIVSLPEWLGAALIGAIVAALGYVAKLLLDWWGHFSDVRSEQRARLLELSSLLRASRALFLVQNAQVRRLSEMLRARLPNERAKFKGFEAAMSALYPQMTSEEKELHIIIRSTTQHGMKHLNQVMLDWLRNDNTYRVAGAKGGLRQDFANALHDLQTHLLMWQAKYEAWIPEHPEHALVYLADEEKHGPGFPSNIHKIITELLK
jgi:hypothetical protein